MIGSIRARLTLWSAGLYGLLLVLLAVGVYTLVARALFDRAEATLRSFGDAAVLTLEHETAEGESLQEAAVSTATELNLLPEHAISIFGGAGGLLAQRGQFVAAFPDGAAEPAGDRRTVVRRVVTGGRHYVVVVSQSGSSMAADLEVLRQVLAAAVPATMVLSAVAAWLLVRRTLRPLEIMARQAEHIGARTLDERLVVPDPGDELGRLAASFNELLGRLDAAFNQQRQFMADASHELRTPLSVIATAAQVTLEHSGRPESEYRDALGIIGHESSRLRQIVNDLFTLARVDADHRQVRPGPLYLDETIAEAVHACRVLAGPEDVAIRLETPSDAAYTGDEALLRRMILNLLDNAVRHTRRGTAVDVTLEQATDEYVVTIADNGDGIPADSQPRIFDRFYQADAARAHGDSGAGAGLGLPIARWIAEAHGGTLTLASSNAQGSTFVVRLPRNPLRA